MYSSAHLLPPQKKIEDCKIASKENEGRTLENSPRGGSTESSPVTGPSCLETGRSRCF